MKLSRLASSLAGLACIAMCALAHAQPTQQPTNPPTRALERLPLGSGAAISSQPGSQALDEPSLNPQSLGASAVQTTIALLLVLSLVLGLALLVRWMSRKGMLPAGLDGGLVGPGRARAVAGVLEVLARYPVGGGSTLLVMKFDKRVLLLHQTRAKGWRGPAQMTTLSELTAAEDVASILLRTRADDDAKRAAEFEAALRREDAAFVRDSATQQPPARQPERARAAVRTPASQGGPARAGSSAPAAALGGGRYA